MDNTVLILIIVAVVAVIVVAALLITRKRKSEHLKHQFGPEYDRAVQQHGDARHAEAVLIDREKRVEKLSLRPLTSVDGDGYAEARPAWQRRFVADPSTALTQADKLVTTVMAARGYPMGDFEQRANDISVNHPTIVQNYQSAREVTLRHAKGEVSTEELRQAMVYFRSLFDELLETPKGASHERIA